MHATGGLKLTLEPRTRDDRRTRFAQVTLDGASDVDTVLVTDSRGRLRYRLPEGQYRVRLLGGEEQQFLVEENRWAAVRLALR
jgi:hypothetical protein